MFLTNHQVHYSYIVITIAILQYNTETEFPDLHDQAISINQTIGHNVTFMYFQF